MNKYAYKRDTSMFLGTRGTSTIIGLFSRATSSNNSNNLSTLFQIISQPCPNLCLQNIDFHNIWNKFHECGMHIFIYFLRNIKNKVSKNMKTVFFVLLHMYSLYNHLQHLKANDSSLGMGHKYGNALKRKLCFKGALIQCFKPSKLY